MPISRTRLQYIQQLLENVRYKDWRFQVLTRGDHLFLRVIFEAPDLVTKNPEIQKGRNWYLSPWMTGSEILNTAFLAVKTAEEHEMRESFRYKGKAIYGPHFDVEALVEIAQQKRFDVREHVEN